MTAIPWLAVLTTVAVASPDTIRESIVMEMHTVRPYIPSSEVDDSTKMQVAVVLLVAFFVSLAITLVIRFLRKYSERQRLYSSFT